jgi:hypothetical protein
MPTGIRLNDKGIGEHDGKKYDKLLAEYMAEDSDRGNDAARFKRLTDAGISSEEAQKCQHYLHPFAAKRILEYQSDHPGQSLIPDVELPYADVIKLKNGALLGVSSHNMGRGVMLSAGIAEMLRVKEEQMRNDTFDPKSDFGLYTKYFAHDRMQDPAFMDRLIEMEDKGGRAHL